MYNSKIKYLDKQERRRLGERMAGFEMHEACTLGDFDTLEDLVLSKRFDINLKDPEWQDKTPLHWACTKG